ncbi:hypothetical protein, partial [Methylobacterium sp. J-076]|uniref:hypothetical protein n=1 Tax=Methylobacterium sp. J-076 TaxID=2836655 RepID=UPI001FBB9EFC
STGGISITGTVAVAVAVVSGLVLAIRLSASSVSGPQRGHPSAAIPDRPPLWSAGFAVVPALHPLP